MFTVREVKEHDEVRGIVTENYPAIYNNQMLIDGTRRILTIGNKKCNFSQDNYIDLNIGEFVQEEEIEH